MRTSIKWIFFLVISFFIDKGYAQTFERNVFSVFSPISVNDTLLVAGGQIMAGIANSPTVEHGYYPLNHSLLTLTDEGGLDHYRIYPNPFATSFFLDLTGITNEVIMVQVYAMNGNIIQTETVTSGLFEINLANVDAGIYYLQGITSGGVAFTEKIIKN